MCFFPFCKMKNIHTQTLWRRFFSEWNLEIEMFKLATNSFSLFFLVLKSKKSIRI
jgi:hypothetical protein